MSRIGKQRLTIPAGVTANLSSGSVSITGPKGTLTRIFSLLVTITQDGDALLVSVNKPTDNFERSLWGTSAAHLKNMLLGVTVGFSKQLEINGVGYKVAMQGKDLKLEVGFSHSVIFAIPAGLTATVEKNLITIAGMDKELVGKISAEIRAIRKPEPYKGKGIKYVTETIRRKAGKAAKAAGAK